MIWQWAVVDIITEVMRGIAGSPSIACASNALCTSLSCAGLRTPKASDAIEAPIIRVDNHSSRDCDAGHKNTALNRLACQ